MIEDAEDSHFPGFMPGIVITLTEHCQPAVTQAVKHQSGELLHICTRISLSGLHGAV